MGYSLGQLGEQHLSDRLLLGITNVDDPGNIDFFSWIDETRLESDVSLEDPSREQMSSATDQNLSLHSSSIHSQQERSYRTEPLDYPRIPTEAHSAQEYNRYDYQTPCYVDFEETNKVTVATTAAPPRLPKSPPGLLVPPERPFTPSSAWIPVYLPNAPNQYYGGLMYTYDTVHHYLQHPHALLYWSTGLLVQADETPGFSIEPSQMHLNDLTNISDVRLEPRNHNISTKQSQTGFNSSSMVEHLPQPHPSHRSKQRRQGTSQYETPNSIELDTATTDSTLKRCWLYCEVLDNKRIICRCSQDPELKSLVQCKGMAGYMRKYEWERAHKTKREFICHKCGKSFKRPDCMRKHSRKHCHLKIRSD